MFRLRSSSGACLSSLRAGDVVPASATKMCLPSGARPSEFRYGYGIQIAQRDRLDVAGVAVDVEQRLEVPSVA